MGQQHGGHWEVAGLDAECLAVELELVDGFMDQLATDFKVISITLFRHIPQLVDCMFVSGSMDSMSMHFAQGTRHAGFPDHTY